MKILNPVNKIVYCLLALFVGALGIHKFYAKKVKAGILYLLLSLTGITGVLAFVDFVVALVKPRNENGKILV